ncbi:hypothetical protein CONCODRAFT_67859 [Conidiobolus coronatus NRRL 28638]|uniref:ELYS-like domain-containing protein n=1 Tax=Conidiobolus coronatus (strain ATCC 28846 / CBS 209.66 / NRRL 28638) TaxID=796925 RepID=A0A137PFZ9_CONC2|nr:hypothetical protein CONCODRAFT_67859 [Conidiobolus coronatus NRRL 28638]|eukprot:KXN73927.1 hypothetical protein CONCODRAFT_67859 [Conidiobolus coronatus NRRL 28638]
MPNDLPKNTVTRIDVFEANLDIFIVLNYDNNYDDKRAEVAPSYHFLIFNSDSVSLSYLKGIEPKLQYTEGRLLNCALLQDLDDSIYFINGFQSTENVEQCDVMLLINKYKEGKLDTVSSQETSFSGNFHPHRIEYINNLTNIDENPILELPSPITHNEIAKIFGKITDLQIANIYSPQVAHSIKSKRSNNCVFLMDKMMESTELDPTEHYPPTSASSLLDLVEKIINSTAETQVSLGIIYYIVTDCKDLISHQTYLELVPLSQRYRTLIDGYWLLDHDYYEKAYKCLISPTLELNWVDLILNNYVHAQELSLGVKLYNHLQPKFSSIDFLRTIVQLFAPSNFPQAYTEIKSRNPTKSQTEELLKYIIYLSIQSSSASQSFTKISFENRDLKFVLRYLSEENGIEFKMLYLLISLKYFKFRQFLNYFENYGNLIESHNDRYYKSFKHIANNLNSSVTI